MNNGYRRKFLYRTCVCTRVHSRRSPKPSITSSVLWPEIFWRLQLPSKAKQLLTHRCHLTQVNETKETTTLSRNRCPMAMVSPYDHHKKQTNGKTLYLHVLFELTWHIVTTLTLIPTFLNVKWTESTISTHHLACLSSIESYANNISVYFISLLEFVISCQVRYIIVFICDSSIVVDKYIASGTRMFYVIFRSFFTSNLQAKQLVFWYFKYTIYGRSSKVRTWIAMKVNIASKASNIVHT